MKTFKMDHLLRKRPLECCMDFLQEPLQPEPSQKHHVQTDASCADALADALLRALAALGHCQQTFAR
jgi:hypothetical protein